MGKRQGLKLSFAAGPKGRRVFPRNSATALIQISPLQSAPVKNKTIPDFIIDSDPSVGISRTSKGFSDAISSRVRFRSCRNRAHRQRPAYNGDLPPANADFSKRTHFPTRACPKMSEDARVFSSVNARVHIQKMRKTTHRPPPPLRPLSSLRRLRRFMILQNEAKLPINPLSDRWLQGMTTPPNYPGPHRAKASFPPRCPRSPRCGGCHLRCLGR